MSTPPHVVPGRREFLHDPAAPPAQRVVALVFALVRDATGRVLLVRRRDTGDWELPGGRVDPGESAADAVVREVAEEAGLVVTPTGVLSLDSDPGHVVDDGPGSVAYQPFAVCIDAVAEPGEPRADGRETGAAAWWEPGRVSDLPMHPAVRRRLAHAASGPCRSVLR